MSENGLSLVYVILSRESYSYRRHVSRFVLGQGKVPVLPFVMHDPFFLDGVGEENLRAANEALLQQTDEIWMFGADSEEIVTEVQTDAKPIRRFVVAPGRPITELCLTDEELACQMVSVSSP